MLKENKGLIVQERLVKMRWGDMIRLWILLSVKGSH